MVELHVTSLDVIHSFWAYQLGVKADANPDVDNVAFVKPTKEQTFEVRCAELCGIWHGYMFDNGHVVSPRGLRDLDPRTAEELRAGDEGAAAVQQDLPTRTDEARQNEHNRSSRIRPPAPSSVRCGGD